MNLIRANRYEQIQDKGAIPAQKQNHLSMKPLLYTFLFIIAVVAEYFMYLLIDAVFHHPHRWAFVVGVCLTLLYIYATEMLIRAAWRIIQKRKT